MHPGGDELYPLPRTSLDAPKLEILAGLTAMVTRGRKGNKTEGGEPRKRIRLKLSGETRGCREW